MATSTTARQPGATAPSPARLATVVSVFLLAAGAVFLAALGVTGPLGLVVSIGGGLVAALLVGSLGEWLVHRYLMQFVAVVSAVRTIEIFRFVRVHDAVHHPGLSRLERFRWFRFLDRHHDIHHVDNQANMNFLLPICDLLMGVLRRDLSPQELALWPSYEQARQSVIRPKFDNQGMRIRTDISTQETSKWQVTSA